MIIGVDGGALAVKDERLKAGVYRVVYNLLLQLSGLDGVNNYRLYTFDRVEEGILQRLGKRFTNVILPRHLWHSLWLPAELAKRPPEAFLGLSQALPRISTLCDIGFIYDLGFLHYPALYPDSYYKLQAQTRLLVTRADRIITISQATARDIIGTYHINANNITVLYPGIDEAFTHKGKKMQSPKPYFLFVGSLKPGKNIPTLLRAFHEVQRSSKGRYGLYIIGGDYWLDPKIKATMNELRLQNSVRLLGCVQDKQLAQYYRRAIAFVSPSLSEGFCLPIAEAMASGCPVIGSDIASLREIAEDAGLFTDALDHEAFARIMLRVAGDGRLRSEMIQKGLKQVKRFSWLSMAKRLLSLIHKA